MLLKNKQHAIHRREGECDLSAAPSSLFSLVEEDLSREFSTGSTTDGGRVVNNQDHSGVSTMFLGHGETFPDGHLEGVRVPAHCSLRY